ncbi:neurochondrin-like [Lineus longissimus]|uniref:neurochondrin-like n=1 Tax=Lineus longissimus TaxID=88925 RepID=UPI002B4CCB3B
MSGDHDVASSQLKECLDQIERSKSDNEMFAALFMVTRLVKAEERDSETRRKIIDAIGFKFIKRLLKTVSVPDDCPKHVFMSLALSLLTSLCTGDQDLMGDPELLELVPVMNELLTIDLSDSDDPAMDKTIADDVMRIFVMIGEYRIGQLKLVESGSLSRLAMMYVDDLYGAKTALDVLLSFLSWADEVPVMWLCNKDGCQELLNKMAAEFRKENESPKFELCETLSRVVCSLHGAKDALNMEPWSSDIYHGLCDILKSRIGETQRDPALKLAAAIIDNYGIEWLLKMNDEKFLLLLVNLATIEVRMILESGPTDSCELMSRGGVLTSCYTILEKLITYMSREAEPPLTGVLQLQSSITEAFNAVLYFLDAHSNDKTVDECFLIATIRVLGAWLAEETSSLRDEVYKILPFLLNESTKNFNQLEKPADDHKTVPPVDLLRFLLPGLCHLSAEDNPRKILIESDAHELLGQYFSYQWNSFTSKQTKDSETALTLLCGIFLNFCVMEPQLVSTHGVFKELAVLVVAQTHTLAGNQRALPLYANMAVLGLMSLRCQKNDRIPAATVNKFLSTVSTFIQDANMIKGDQLAMSKSYKLVWDDISELWFLATQELCCLVEKYPSFPAALVDNGWLAYALKMFKQTRGRGAQEEMVPAYDRLLTTMVSVNDHARTFLKDNDCLNIARLCGMASLKTCLDR